MEDIKGYGHRRTVTHRSCLSMHTIRILAIMWEHWVNTLNFLTRAIHITTAGRVGQAYAYTGGNVKILLWGRGIFPKASVAIQPEI